MIHAERRALKLVRQPGDEARVCGHGKGHKGNREHGFVLYKDMVQEFWSLFPWHMVLLFDTLYSKLVQACRN